LVLINHLGLVIASKSITVDQFYAANSL